MGTITSRLAFIQRLRKSQALFLYLTSTPGQFYRNEMVTQLLWDSSTGTKAANSFRQALRQIRVEAEDDTANALISRNGTIGFGAAKPNQLTPRWLRPFVTLRAMMPR
jgi:DNA-binding SARP family transcriptional activator